MTIYNCDPSELVEKASSELKKIDSVKPPTWAPFVKTGMHRERPPIKTDWWYARAASVLRQIYIHGPIGVSKLRTKYGGKPNRGYKPEHFYKGSGNIVRKILQQLEKAGFVKNSQAGVHKGRVITAEGKKFLDTVALGISVQIQRAEKMPASDAKTAETKEEKKEKASQKKKAAEKKSEKAAESKSESKEESIEKPLQKEEEKA